jgi:hypothetical protein
MPRAKYSTVDNINHQPLLEITKEKLCQMPYLTDYQCATEPWASADCDQFSYDQLSMYNCMCKGMVGRPVHFEYTAESAADWGNPRCCDESGEYVCPCYAHGEAGYVL